MALQEVMMALSDPARRRVLETLRGGPATAGELAEAVRMSPSALSYHLTRLKDAGLVRDYRQGRFIVYRLNLTVLDDLVVWLSGLTESKDPGS